MGQLTIYLDDETRQRVDKAAELSGKSVSAWVKAKIDQALTESWPEGYFSLFGSLKDRDLKRPENLPIDEVSKLE